MDKPRTADRLRNLYRTTHDWLQTHVPPGLRLLLGLLLIIGGLLGFLPILGFWMIPLGFAVAAMDIRPVMRAVTALFSHRD